MKKGKFGIILCFYPIAAFAAVILNSPLACLLLAAAAIFLERDEWAGRQTLQAWMAAVVVAFFQGLSRGVSNFFYIPVLSSVLSAAATILSVLVYLGAIVFSVLAILRVSKGEEANFPLMSSLAYRIFGLVRPKPAAPQYPPYQPPQQPVGYSYPPEGGVPQQPYAAPQYPPQGPAAPQYAPPMNPSPQQPPQPPQPPQTPPQGNGQGGSVNF